MPERDTPDGSGPARIAGYRLIRLLAEGGQGAVHLAESPTGERVAVKVLHASWLADPAARSRLAKEVAAARQVAPFCTAQVIEARLDGETPLIVSEFVPGPSLAELVTGEGPVTGAALDRLAIGTVTALVAIHRAHIVHRDFKPANVMMGPDGPRVIDFGIARDLTGEATLTDRLLGTPSYMAPEHLSGAVVGPPADLFAWASTMVFAATGHPPFRATNLGALMHQILQVDPELAEIPGSLREVLARCLTKDPGGRPDAQDALLMLLGRFQPTRAPAGLTSTLAQASQLAAGPVTGSGPGWSPTPPPSVPQLLAALDSEVPRPQWLIPFISVLAVVVLVVVGAVVAVNILTGPGPTSDPVVAGGTRNGSSPSASVSAPDVSTPASSTPGSLTGSTSPQHPTTAAYLVVPDTFHGIWTGKVTPAQSAVTPWEVRITLKAGFPTGSIEYPTLNCSGDLTVVAPGPHSSELHLDAVTIYDPQKHCASAAHLVLTHEIGDPWTTVRFRWVDAADSQNRADAALTMTQLGTGSP